MPVDYAGMREQVARAVQQQAAQRARLDGLARQAQALLRAWAEGEARQRLAERVEQALRLQRGWRGAQPLLDLDEPLTAVHPPPAPVADWVVLAADGSQINPDRHAEVYFGLINIGLVAFGATGAPLALVRSRLLIGEDLFVGAEEGPGLGLQRDLAERQALAWAVAVLRGEERIRRQMEQAFAPLAEASPGAGQAEGLQAWREAAWVVTLTDGPLELWGARPGEEGAAYAPSLQSYLDALEQLRCLQALPVGYVDRPRADLVVRMLELVQGVAPTSGVGPVPEVLPGAGTPGPDGSPGAGAPLGGDPARPFLGLSDRELMVELLRQPGARSTLFRLRSQALERYAPDLAPWFFYLNVSPWPERPWVVRVEVPAWVGRDPQAVQVVHAVLWEQCRIVPGRAYPYALHRAHETAVVTREDREQVSRLLLATLQQALGVVPERSQKQRLKDDFTRRAR